MSVCIYIYICEICAEGIYVYFPGDKKKCEKKVEDFFFSNGCHFEILFPKKETNVFFFFFFSEEICLIYPEKTHFAQGV